MKILPTLDPGACTGWGAAMEGCFEVAMRPRIGGASEPRRVVGGLGGFKGRSFREDVGLRGVEFDATLAEEEDRDSLPSPACVQTPLSR